MANNFSDSFPEIWAKEQQTEFFKQNVAMKICKFEQGLEGKKYGDTLNRTYSNMSAYVDPYVPGTAMSIEDLSDTAEQLLINKKFSKGFYVDEMDDIQSAYSAALEYGKKSGEYLSNQVDAEVLYEALSAASTVTVGTLATNNIVSAITGANKALTKKNVIGKDKYAVISPEFEEILVQYVENKATVKGDQVGMNGYLMTWMGYDFYISNQLASSAELVLSADVTASDTVTIAGVTFTFVASIGTDPGNVLAGANAAASRVNLVTLLNAPGTTTATGVALTGDDLKLIRSRISATNDIANTKVVVNAKGLGVLDVAEGITAAADVWTATAQLQHNLFGLKGNPYLIVQRMPKVVERTVSDKMGNNYLNTVLFGVKTFRDNSYAMVDVTIRCDAYNA